MRSRYSWPSLVTPSTRSATSAPNSCRDLLAGHHRIFHHIVEQTGNDRLLIQLQIRQDDCNTKRMNDIRLTGLAHLSLDGRLYAMLYAFSIIEISAEG